MARTWLTAATPLILLKGEAKAPSVTLEVELTTGNVQIEHLSSDDVTWVTIPNDENANIILSGIYVIERANTPAVRVTPYGDALVSVVK